MACGYNRWADPDFLSSLEADREEFVHDGAVGGCPSPPPAAQSCGYNRWADPAFLSQLEEDRDEFVHDGAVGTTCYSPPPAPPSGGYCGGNRWADPGFLSHLSSNRGDFMHTGFEETEWNTAECSADEAFAEACRAPNPAEGGSISYGTPCGPSPCPSPPSAPCGYNKWADPEFLGQLESCRGDFMHSGFEDTEWNTPECIDAGESFGDPCGEPQSAGPCQLPPHSMIDHDDCLDPYGPGAPQQLRTPPHYPGIADVEYPCTPRRYDDVARMTPEAGTPCATPPGHYNMGGFMMPLGGPAALQPDPMAMRDLLQTQMECPGSGGDRARAQREHYVNYFKRKAEHDEANCARPGQRADGVMAARVQQVIEGAIEDANLPAHIRSPDPEAAADGCAPPPSSSTSVEDVLERLVDSLQDRLAALILAEEEDEPEPPEPFRDPCEPPSPEQCPPPYRPPVLDCTEEELRLQGWEGEFTRPDTYFAGLMPATAYSPPILPGAERPKEFTEEVEKALCEAFEAAKVEKHVNKKKEAKKSMQMTRRGSPPPFCIRTPETTPTWSTSTSSDEVIVRLQRKLQSNLQVILRKYGLPTKQRRCDMEDMEAVSYLMEEEGYGYKPKPHPSHWQYAPRGTLYEPGVSISDDEFEDACAGPAPRACGDEGDWPVYNPADFCDQPDVLRAPPSPFSPPMEGVPPPRRRALHELPAHKQPGSSSYQPMACGSDLFGAALRPGLRKGPMKSMLGNASGVISPGSRRHSIGSPMASSSPRTSPCASPPAPVPAPSFCSKTRTPIPQSSRRTSLCALPSHRQPGAQKHQSMATATSNFAGGLRSGLCKGPTTLGGRKPLPPPVCPAPSRPRPAPTTSAGGSSRLCQLPAHKRPGAPTFTSMASGMGSASGALRQNLYPKSCAPKPLMRKKPPPGPC